MEGNVNKIHAAGLVLLNLTEGKYTLWLYQRTVRTTHNTLPVQELFVFLLVFTEKSEECRLQV